MVARIFLCRLAYFVERDLIEAWRPLLLADEDQLAKPTRDSVALADRSEQALQKVHLHTLPDGNDAHSLRTLLEDLSKIVLSTCRTA